jgi:uncharacterized SAM-binding protein YcdF (DUF218 family)
MPSNPAWVSGDSRPVDSARGRELGVAVARMTTAPAEEEPEDLTSPAADKRPRRRRRYRLRIALAIIIVLFAAVTARVFIWPDLAPLPERADAIIELGGPTIRDEAALELARDHRAPVLVQSTVQAEAGTHSCLPPVPDVTILCFHADPGTTRGEARAIGEMAARYHWDSIILVTTPDHAWRSSWRVSRCFPGEIFVSTSDLPFWSWFRQIPYQWAASAKAVTLERGC